MIYSPLEQFNISSYFGYGMINNINIYFALTLVIVFTLISSVIRNRSIITDSLVINIIIDAITNNLIDNIGIRSNVIYSYIIALGISILLFNIIGLLPYSFTITSYFNVTILLSNTIILTTIIISIVKYRLVFISAFIPSGTPLALLPLLLIIETISYLARSLSLGLRLAANLIAGHSLLFIIANFIIVLFAINPILSVIGYLLLLTLFIMEFIISILQVYVFVLLTITYFVNAYYLH